MHRGGRVVRSQRVPGRRAAHVHRGARARVSLGTGGAAAGRGQVRRVAHRYIDGRSCIVAHRNHRYHHLEILTACVGV